MLDFEIGAFLEALSSFLPAPLLRKARGIAAAGMSILRAFGAVGRTVIRLPTSGLARQAAAAAARHAARISARAVVRAGRFITNPEAIKGAVLRIGQASLKWLRSPAGKSFLWGTSGATFIHLVTPAKASDGEEDLWKAIESLTFALHEAQDQANNNTAMWRDIVEQQSIQTMAMENDRIVEEMLKAAATSIRHVRSQLNSLVEGRFRIDMLSPPEWEALWAQLHKTADRAGMMLLGKNTADLAHIIPRLDTQWTGSSRSHSTYRRHARRTS
jgi:hypothetical protein